MQVEDKTRATWAYGGGENCRDGIDYKERCGLGRDGVQRTMHNMASPVADANARGNSSIARAVTVDVYCSV